ncbi:MAG: PD40 domain-containing protein [Solirubrobacterales bacterium]|nr:PD40 domain-containing protein [Solirubrobacterales bacterium]MCB0860454.1 PD40 domain-containing protein [Solirubrobacterales bacterium]
MLFAAALLPALTILAIGAGDSQALSPPQADKAEIVYSNGGRIMQVTADGSGRKVLTNRGKVRTPGGIGDPVGDRLPRVSPDGSRVLFTRITRDIPPDNEFLFHSRNMLLNLDTGKVRRVLARDGRVSYYNLEWLPGTNRVLAARLVRGKADQLSLVSVNLDGSGLKTILKYRSYAGGMPKDDWNFEAARLAISPDGRNLLVTAMDIWSESGYRLGLVNLETGKRKLIAKGAHSGAWSPDGNSFVFVKDRRKAEVCDWDFECTPSGDLFTAKADGTGIRRLTDTRRDEATPSFSPDGSRIVFSGTFHRPSDRTTAELFSMSADGGCPVRITNGSPASLDPFFVPGSGDYAYPGGCEPVDRPALVETGLNRVKRKDFGRRLWLGKESSQGLLSMDFDYVFLSYTLYGDCSESRAKDCPPGATVFNGSVCLNPGSWAEKIADLVRSKRKMKRRGVWVEQSRVNGNSSGRATWVYSGRWITTITGAVGPGNDGFSRLGYAAQLDLVDELRPRGVKPGARLPKLLIPTFDFQLARFYRRQVERSSVTEVAKKFRVSRRKVRDLANFTRNLRRLGPYGRTRCPDASFPVETDSGSDRS